MMETRRPPLSRRIARLVTPAGLLRLAALPAILPLLGFLGGTYWILDLLNHFQAQYFVLILTIAIGLGAWRKWRHALVVAVLAAIPGMRLAPLYLPERADADRARLRVATFNVLGTNTRHAEVAEWIRQADPDFIYLPETNEDWGAGLACLDASHPYRVDDFIEGNFGFSFRSRFPILRPRIHPQGTMGLPLLEAVVATPHGEVTVFGAHPVPPVTAYWASERDTFLSHLAELAKGSSGRVIVMGDLNATRWSRAMRPLLEQGLADSAAGRGFSATWMRGNPFAAIPIDHILTRGFHGTFRRETGPGLGSDHCPVVVDLVW